MLITNNTSQDYYFGALHVPASGTVTVDDSSATSLYLTDDAVADAINTLAASGKISVSGVTAGIVFPRPTGEPAVLHGDGSPEGLVYAPQGTIYLRRDVAQIFQKTTGVHINTGWNGLTSGGGAVESTTVAGLGAGSAGKVGRLRLGSSPFDFEELTYDSVYGKWISDVERYQILSFQPVTQSLGSSGSWVNYVYALNNVIGLETQFCDFNSRLIAGLTPQLRLTADLDWGASGSATGLQIRPMIFSSSQGSVPTTGTAAAYTGAAPPSFAGANVRQVRRGPWANPDAPVTQGSDFYELGVAALPTYTGSASVIWRGLVAELRWVA